MDSGTRAIRNSIIGMVGLQALALAWMLSDRYRAGTETVAELDLLVFLLASMNVVLVGPVIWSRYLRSVRRELKVLCLVSVTTSLVCFAFVDYGTLRQSRPLPFIVLGVAVVLRIVRRR